MFKSVVINLRNYQKHIPAPEPDNKSKAKYSKILWDSYKLTGQNIGNNVISSLLQQW